MLLLFETPSKKKKKKSHHECDLDANRTLVC